ncbi:hypothetical protein A2U01_0078980, partial [Trifolium medium]|nr:hypothetical protein [Trifolium medium]
RVLEETGGESVSRCGGGKICSDWQEDNSSRASFGVESNFEAGEGVFSETESDADVSESCQVLLELQAHRGKRSVVGGASKELG